MRLFARQDGGVAVPFSLGVLVLAVLGCGAVDMTSLHLQRVQMQDAADSAALSAATELSVANSSGAIERAEQQARAELQSLAKAMDLTISGAVSEDGSRATIIIRGHRASYFASLLPPGGWNISVSATGMPVALAPLCVLSTSTGAGAILSMRDSARLTAPGCLVQSNSDLDAAESSALLASIVQAAGTASGNVVPTPQSGAPAIDDPFAAMSIEPNLPLCTPLDVILAAGVTVLAPGVHCGNIKVDKDTTLQLLPGDHYFQGKLELKTTGVLTGTDVVLIFDDRSNFQFQDDAEIDLEGRKTGPYAGFVIATTRANTKTFEISSTSAKKLLGTIYIPSARLLVSGDASQVADQSDWTVIVAREIAMTGSPNLVINTDYKGSPVPVPKNIPGASGVRLEK